jgi:putative hemolysin
MPWRASRYHAVTLMDATLFLFIFLLPLLLAVIALCSASETSFFSLTRSDRLRLRRRSPSAGAAATRLLARPRALVLTILLITNAGNVAFYVIVSVLERRLGHGVLGVAFNVGILFTLILFGDLLPKLIAASNPVHLARVLALPLEVAVRVVGPVTRFLEGWLVDPTLRLIRSSPSSQSEAVTADELGTLLDLSARSGEIEQDEQRLLADVIRLGSTRVRDVMIPRVAMPWLSERWAPADLVRVLKRWPGDRIPVFRGSPDGRPLGFMDVRTSVAAAEPTEFRPASRDGSVRGLEPITFIPERARMDQLLDLLRARRTEEALCVDEYGAVVGMITVNEVLAELVAGARAGTADGGGAATIERRSANCWVIPGRLPARELAVQLAADGPRFEGVSTVAGLFFHTLGRVPVQGDTVRLGNVELRVESMSGRIIDRIAVTLLPSGAAA